MFLQVSATLCGMPRYQEETLRAVGRAVQARMSELRHSPISLAGVAGVDQKTVRTLMDGTRWLRVTSRTPIEEALGWQPGTVQDMADGLIRRPASGDPVKDAIETSDLTQANKHTLLGTYYRMLQEQEQAEGVRGA